MATAKDKTKAVAKFVVGFSTSFAVTALVKQNTHSDKTHQKVELALGGFALGWMVGDAAEAWTDRKIDELWEMFQNPGSVNRL